METKYSNADLMHMLHRVQYGSVRDITSKIESDIKELGKACEKGASKQEVATHLAYIERDIQKNESLLKSYPLIFRQYNMIVDSRNLTELRDKVSEAVRIKLKKRYGE